MTHENSLLRQLQHGCGELHADATEMLAARVELAQLELRLASTRTSRLAIVWGGCGLISLAGYVIVVQLAAERLPSIGGLSYTKSLALVGFTLLAVGALFGWLAMRRFCRKFRHFEQTFAEVKADLVAVQSWLDRSKKCE